MYLNETPDEISRPLKLIWTVENIQLQSYNSKITVNKSIMESIFHKGQKYTLHIGFRDDDSLRIPFNRLTKRVYGFDFENWHQHGYWGEKYIPYALMQGDEMVSNVSISIIDFLVDEKKRTFIQIGSVMTNPDKRHQGLNKLLLEKVLQDWRDNCDLIYLFANNTVLDFYPKFGFRQIDQWQYARQIIAKGNNHNVTKLDMSLPENKQLLHDKINCSIPVSKLSMIQNASLVLFYYTVFLAQNVYQIDELNALAIADFEDGVMYLHDVYSQSDVALDEVVSALANDAVNNTNPHKEVVRQRESKWA
ncbi:GNAT family N-acetyltransferase [Aliiglaciecola sp. M165]|uniref:GNAT family N-acetyltransferase n=1 Tax=Aliiglaciecola sp. M165 TaxID=2593649 RepID=UPI00117FD260|nr:GNAT family N-acetyltransferase [Aliiglaciecola sp. M165]TRY31835.1 GNAT family N-acetyltransferase [Aliiglaciecola sp. M165]